MDRRLTGISASPGIVAGPVYVLHWEVPEVTQRIVSDEEIPAEIDRFHQTLGRARDRLESVRRRAAHHAGEEEARIFEAQILMMQDTEMIGRVEALIRQNLAAESAFEITMLDLRQHFARHASAMMRERVGDLADVQIRILSLLLGLPDHDPVNVPKGANAILVTHDLTPSLTVQLDREAIAAIATDEGTRISHVAILARSLGIPAVVGLRDATSRLRTGEMAILDGAAGTISVNPTADEIRHFNERSKREAKLIEELELLRSAESVTVDGERIVLRANVDFPEEADFAARSGADGVGLMRTEFLVVGRSTMPDEEEQFRAYRKVAESFNGAPVVIRTYDIGGDKLPVGGHPAEANPFLGWRAIRMCLDEPEMFKVQLRALMRAASFGDVRIMLPLVVTQDEVRQARALLAECSTELEARGLAHRKDIPVGVMIETPAAAVSADSFVGDASFFSIGTNDLTQYTLAIDRGNANLAPRFTPLHPAVLRLIRRTVEVGDVNGIEVTVCGEMASQPLTAFALIGLGVRSMSVSPRSVTLLKRLVLGTTATVAAEAARQAMESRTAAASEALILRAFTDTFGEVAELLDGLPHAM